MNPLSLTEMTTEVQALFDGTRPLNIHSIIANHADLMLAYWPLRQHVVLSNSLPPHIHELLILRIAHRSHSAYEWEHHVVRGQKAGLTLEQIEGVRSGVFEWTPDERLILTFVDEMLDTFHLGAETAEEMLKAFGKNGVLDAVMTAAVYIALATILNTFDVEIDS